MAVTGAGPTAAAATTTTPRKVARRWALTFLGALGVAAALTGLFYGMRSVMEIGGSCASGNTPFEIARPCPDGVGGVMVGSIFGGLIFLGIYAFSTIGPNLTLLAWPALFLSLGWNFLEYGVNPPTDDDGGVVVGWLICGVVFVAMGGIPLVGGLLTARATRRTLRAAREAAQPAVERDSRWNPRVAGWVLQIVALGVGVWVGIELFESTTGTTITFG